MRKKLKPVFLVLEALWSEDLRDLSSIYPFISGLCAANEWTLYYRRFDSVNDIQHWVDRFQRMRVGGGKAKILYLAAHGTLKGLETREGLIPGAKLVPILRKAPSIRGVHLGSCALARSDMPRRLIEKTKVRWVAGYTKEVHWLESTLVDLLFLDWMYTGVPKGERSWWLGLAKTPAEIYRRFAVAEALGFTVFYRPKYAREIESSLLEWKQKKKSVS